MSDDYFTWQAKKQRREGEQTMPVRRLYPEPKKDRREAKGKKR